MTWSGRRKHGETNWQADNLAGGASTRVRQGLPGTDSTGDGRRVTNREDQISMPIPLSATHQQKTVIPISDPRTSSVQFTA